MVYGELGRFPLEVEIKTRMVMFWYKLITGGNKLSSQLYSLVLNMNETEYMDFKWLNMIGDTLNNTGLSYIWNQQSLVAVSKECLKNEVRQKLMDG